MKRIIILAASHVAAIIVGFGAGIYALPILTAPPAPTAAQVRVAVTDPLYTGRFQRDLADSDALHWGEGAVFVGRKAISLEGRIAPGPDYKLYLSPEFVETEERFLKLKPEMARIGDVKTFENFIVPVPQTIDPEAYNTVIVWCEAFGQFITAAQYR